MWVNSNSEYLPELEKLYTRFDFLREEYSVEKLTTKTEKKTQVVSQIWGENNRKLVTQEGWESMVAGAVQSIADYHPYLNSQKARRLYG